MVNAKGQAEEKAHEPEKPREGEPRPERRSRAPLPRHAVHPFEAAEDDHRDQGRGRERRAREIGPRACLQIILSPAVALGIVELLELRRNFGLEPREVERLDERRECGTEQHQ
jgi:hypothetical protein